MAKENTFFTEHVRLADSPVSVYFLLGMKKVVMRLNKKKIKFFQRNIEENSNSIVQNQEQVAVRSIASVVKTSTTSYTSGKSRISNKSSSIGSRVWTQNDIIELIAIWNEKEAQDKTFGLFY